MTEIISIFGREVLDSRGNPTVEVEVELEVTSYESGTQRVSRGPGQHSPGPSLAPH